MEDTVQKAIDAHGGEHIRLLDVSIPDEALIGLWKVPEVKGATKPAREVD